METTKNIKNAIPGIQDLIRNKLEVSISYAEYRNLIDSLLAEGKTTGENHSEAYLNYTRMNVQRMKRPL